MQRGRRLKRGLQKKTASTRNGYAINARGSFADARSTRAGLGPDAGDGIAGSKRSNESVTERRADAYLSISPLMNFSTRSRAMSSAIWRGGCFIV